MMADEVEEALERVRALIAEPAEVNRWGQHIVGSDVIESTRVDLADLRALVAEVERLREAQGPRDRNERYRRITTNLNDPAALRSWIDELWDALDAKDTRAEKAEARLSSILSKAEEAYANSELSQGALYSIRDWITGSTAPGEEAK